MLKLRELNSGNFLQNARIGKTFLNKSSIAQNLVL